MKIKVIRARNKALINKVIDLGSDCSEDILSYWHILKQYKNVLFKNKVYTASIYTPNERELVNEPNKKPHISMYVTGGNGQGSSIDIWEFEYI